MYYKKNRARYRGKDTKTSTPFLMQVPMKRLLAHVSTKDELTQYLAMQSFYYRRESMYPAPASQPSKEETRSHCLLPVQMLR